MNAASGGVFAGTGLGKKQYRNIALRKLPDHTFHGPQASTGAVHEFGHNGFDSDFGIERSRWIIPAWVWFTHFALPGGFSHLEPQIVPWQSKSTLLSELPFC